MINKNLNQNKFKNRKASKIAIYSLLIASVLTAIIVPTTIILSNNKTFTVTFDSDGGTKVASQIIKNGGKAKQPNNPRKGDIQYNFPFNEWQLDGTKFDFSNPITKNITLKANYDYSSKILWYLDSDYIKDLTVNDIGIQRGVIVNEKLHKVRLIGIDHDIDKNDKKLHTTWEFSNIISDENGNSLGYQWNDFSDSTKANFDYLNSTIRYALTGQGNNGGKTGESENEILVARKGETSWCNDSKYKKTVINMFPSDFVDSIKDVKKSVGVVNDSSTNPAEFVSQSYTDKLFLLSAKELGFASPADPGDKGEGEPYSYYKNATKRTEAIRVKKQINNEEYIVTELEGVWITTGYKCPSTGVLNYAGYNSKIDESEGGPYWLSSPCYKENPEEPGTLTTKATIRCKYDGTLNMTSVFDYVRGVAPAFCL